MANCLVIIDVQKGFMTNEETLEIPQKIKLLIRKKHFDHIVCTQFYNSVGSPYERFLDWHDLMDSASQSIATEVAEISEVIIRKPIYTCFVPEFCDFIDKNKIDKLYFLGIDTDCCVLKSCTDCFERNIPFEVLINYCASNGGKASHQAAITVMERTIGNNCINRDL